MNCGEPGWPSWLRPTSRFWWRDRLHHFPAVKLQYATKVAFTPVSNEQRARAFHPVSITQCRDRFAFCQAFMYESEENARAHDLPMPPSRCSMDGAHQDRWDPSHIWDMLSAWCYGDKGYRIYHDTVLQCEPCP